MQKIGIQHSAERAIAKKGNKKKVLDIDEEPSGILNEYFMITFNFEQVPILDKQY